MGYFPLTIFKKNNATLKYNNSSIKKSFNKINLHVEGSSFNVRG
jgi:hypothetical protein